MSAPTEFVRRFGAAAWGQTADAKDMGQLEKPLRDRLWTAAEYARREQGYILHLVSGHRTPYQQYVLRHDRCPGNEWSFSACSGDPDTATPGSSDHQKRKAADIGFNWPNHARGKAWLKANEARFGLDFNVSSEDWHVVAAGTPRVPIIEYPGPAYDKIVPGVPEGWVLPDSPKEQIKLLQVLLAMSGKLDADDVDGVYGTITGQAVRNFKAGWNKMGLRPRLNTSKEKGWMVGPNTLKALATWVNFIQRDQ